MNILVTGGASGLGASIVKALAADTRHTVYFTYARSEAAARDIEATHQNTKAIHCDFSETASIDALNGQIQSLDIEVLINNAFGSIHQEHFYKIKPEVFLKSFEFNILPTLSITASAIKVFRKKKFGKIINIISSYVVNTPPTGLSEYVANKAYLLSMSKSWAAEGIRFNITSNSVSPSTMLTGLIADTDERVIEQMKESHPLKDLLTTDEAAASVVYLVNAGQHINGINLVINAGVSMQ